MPDHTCRCCHDKRKSTDANGKPNGRAKTACQQLAGCIQPDASPGISSIVPIRGQLNLFGNLVSGAVNAQATPQPSEGIDTTAVAEGPQAGGGASRSPPELALDTQTQATTAEGSAESASAEPGEPRQSSSAAAASATPARTPSRRSGGLFGSGAIAVRAEQRDTRFLTPPRTDNLCWFARTLFWFRVCVSANGPLLEVRAREQGSTDPTFPIVSTYSSIGIP